MTMTAEAPHASGRERTSVAFTDEDLRLLRACVGFLSMAGTDPPVRGRLDELWCRLDRAHKGWRPSGVENAGQEPRS